MRRLPVTAMRLLDEAIGYAPMAPFARAVIEQLSSTMGATREPGEATTMLLALLRAAAVTERGIDEAATRLLTDPPLFAAVYENLDLLADVRGAPADSLSAAVMRALERAS
jgi:hypothetical protein